MGILGDVFAPDDSGLLPLFPLGTVLFPGVTLPLHIFEDRYRQLMDDVMALPADRPRRFGVVAIESGHEVGPSAAHRLAPVGCGAEVVDVRRHDDGRLDLVVAGDTRFRIDELVEADSAVPYLRAAATPLPDELGDAAEEHAERVSRRFATYLERVQALGIAVEAPEETTTDPLRLSYLIPAVMALDRGEKQRLLEDEHASARLERIGGLLRRENRILPAIPSLPATKLPQQEFSRN